MLLSKLKFFIANRGIYTRCDRKGRLITFHLIEALLCVQSDALTMQGNSGNVYEVVFMKL